MLTNFLRPNASVPHEHKHNFWHLYFDIAWFGVLNGSALAFVAVYAVRLGANGLEIGLLTALPGMVALMLSLPSGRWLARRNTSQTVFWLSIAQRLGYASWALVPLIPSDMGRVWALIIISLLMSIPGTALAIGFNAMFADVVPLEWRGHVVGVRNALYALTFVVTSLLCGLLLDFMPFHQGYLIVFIIGGAGALMSSAHLWFVRPTRAIISEAPVRQAIGEIAGLPGRMLGRRIGVGLRALVQTKPLNIFRNRILGSYKGRVLLALFAFHLALFIAGPVFPLFYVDVLHLTDWQISLGLAFFYLMMFLTSSQLNRLTKALGNYRLSVIGILLLGAYPLLMSFTNGLPMYFAVLAYGGLSWAITNGALSNYILDVAGVENREVFLAWFIMATNAALLVGSLLGPVLAEWFGIGLMLGIFGVLRIITALLLLVLGRQQTPPAPQPSAT